MMKFIGSYVDLKKIRAHWEKLDDEDFEGEAYEKYIESDSVGPDFDEHGFNAYSVVLILDGMKITDIRRIAHCHMCGGQGVDEELDNFPYKALERAATVCIRDVICTKEVAARKMKMLHDAEKKARLASEKRARRRAKLMQAWPPLRKLQKFIEEGGGEKFGGAEKLIDQCTSQGYSGLEIYEQGLKLGLNKLLCLFQEERAFLPDLLTGVRAFGQALGKIKEKFPNFEIPHAGKILMVTLGRIIADPYWKAILKAYGYSIVDLQFDIDSDPGEIAVSIKEKLEPIIFLWVEFQSFAYKMISHKEVEARVLRIIEEIRKQCIDSPILVDGYFLSADFPRNLRPKFNIELIGASRR